MPSGVYIKTEEHKRKIAKTCKRKGLKPPVLWGNKNWLGKHRSNETKEKIREKMKGRIISLETRQKMSLKRQKEKHWNWKKDRTQIIGRHNRNMHDPDYKQFRLGVCNRDGWKCKINNSECSDKLEVHHILGWKSHPELRYEVNNGITLCHFHHPRKRNDEMKLSPYFKSLVEN